MVSFQKSNKLYQKGSQSNDMSYLITKSHSKKYHVNEMRCFGILAMGKINLRSMNTFRLPCFTFKEPLTFTEIIERDASLYTSPSSPKKPLQNLPCTKKFYKKLSAEISKLTSAEKVVNFLAAETKSRKLDRKNSLTKKLEQASWRDLREETKRRLESEMFLKNEKKFLKKLRLLMTCWILFPHLKGEKPHDWNQILIKLSSWFLFSGFKMISNKFTVKWTPFAFGIGLKIWFEPK